MFKKLLNSRMKAFWLTLSLTSLWIKSLPAIETQSLLHSRDPQKLESSFLQDDKVFVFDRKTIEKLRVDQIQCQQTNRLYADCLKEAQPNRFLTANFIFISTILALGVGFIGGLYVGVR